MGDDWACAAENHLPENNVKIFRRIPEGQPLLLSLTFPLKRAHPPLSLFVRHKRMRFTCLIFTAPPLLLISCCSALRLILLSSVCLLSILAPLAPVMNSNFCLQLDSTLMNKSLGTLLLST